MPETILELKRKGLKIPLCFLDDTSFYYQKNSAFLSFSTQNISFLSKIEPETYSEMNYGKYKLAEKTRTSVSFEHFSDESFFYKKTEEICCFKLEYLHSVLNPMRSLQDGSTTLNGSYISVKNSTLRILSLHDFACFEGNIKCSDSPKDNSFEIYLDLDIKSICEILSKFKGNENVTLRKNSYFLEFDIEGYNKILIFEKPLSDGFLFPDRLYDELGFCKIKKKTLLPALISSDKVEKKADSKVEAEFGEEKIHCKSQIYGLFKRMPDNCNGYFEEGTGLIYIENSTENYNVGFFCV